MISTGVITTGVSAITPRPAGRSFNSGRIMQIWQDIEATADENGFIPESIYARYACRFAACPPPDPQRKSQETRVWDTYLSTRKRRHKQSLMYQELYRYEWYEGRRRTGFWGNMEKALKQLEPGPAPVVSILSAGTGRDLIKVGLATGIFTSIAHPKIRGTHREITIENMRLAKPGARIMVTECNADNLSVLRDTVARLIRTGALTPEMITVRRWDFRQMAPLAGDSQDIVVFSLTGNCATIDEQPLILREIARCVKPDGHLIASTMTDKIDFKKAGSHLGKLRLMLTTPLAIPVALDFIPWQIRWGKMAARMNELGYWKNVPAGTWMKFLEPAAMEQIAIYPGPSKFLPVEVLVARKKFSTPASS